MVTAHARLEADLVVAIKRGVQAASEIAVYCVAAPCTFGHCRRSFLVSATLRYCGLIHDGAHSTHTFIGRLGTLGRCWTRQPQTPHFERWLSASIGGCVHGMQITTSAVSASAVLMNWISGRFTAQALPAVRPYFSCSISLTGSSSA
jgi:hypothetical protein